jgi:hypothetical protein
MHLNGILTGKWVIFIFSGVCAQTCPEARETESCAGKGSMSDAKHLLTPLFVSGNLFFHSFCFYFT